SGSLSSAHASLSNDCGACHQKAFESVTDATCKSCHAKIPDHAQMDRLRLAMFEPGLGGAANRQLAHSFNLPEGRCASCHKEHEGPKGLATTNAAQCVECHTDLTAKLPDTKLGNAGDFTDEHPQLRPAIVATPAFGQPKLVRVSMDARPRENSGLKFPHDIHLSKTNGVARMAMELAQYNGKALDCASCHRPSAGAVRFQAIEMERDCGACHSLAFDRSGGTIRTLRHGEPQQVVAELRDFYRLGGAGEAPERQRPGMAIQSVVRSGARPIAGLSVDARIRSVFEPGGACYDCHTVIAPKAAGSLDFRIAPVSLPDRYLWNGWFSHADHDTADMPCASCHKANTSKVSADLLLPDLKRCRDCHVSPAHAAKDKTVSDCAACHVYHEGSPLPSQIRGAKTAQSDQKRKSG
ncbi:MAG: cytochrome c3 family protein, partial [Alphaproteobacteria bacterium]|nr:cytochrome c3 family protein [Alphaproteobacteria bacterium]